MLLHVAGTGGDAGAAGPFRPDPAGPFPAERVRLRRDLAGWATVRIQRPGGRPSPSPGSARSGTPPKWSSYRTRRTRCGRSGHPTASRSRSSPEHRAARKVLVTGGPARVLAETGTVAWSAARGRPASSCSGPGTDAFIASRIREGRLALSKRFPGSQERGNLHLRGSYPMADTSWSTLRGTRRCISRRLTRPALGRFWTTPRRPPMRAGHLFYSRGAGLFARPFDAERLEVSGAEVQVTAQAATFSVSDHGTIVYRPEASRPRG